jgi:hypothetical protein
MNLTLIELLAYNDFSHASHLILYYQGTIKRSTDEQERGSGRETVEVI